MSRLIAIVLVVALSMSTGCSRIIGDRDAAPDQGQQSAGDEAFSRGTSGTDDLDIQDFDYDEFEYDMEDPVDEPRVEEPDGQVVDEPESVQDEEPGEPSEPEPTTPVVADGYVTEVFQPIPVETGTVVLNAGSIGNRTMAGDNAEDQSFRAFWSFDVSKVRFSDVQEATLRFTHKETAGDPFRLDNQTLGIGGVQVWVIRTDEGELPPYNSDPFVTLTDNPIFDSPSEFDLTTYVRNIGDNMSKVDRVQVMVGFQRGTNRNGTADYMEWESATLTVKYAPH